MIPPVTAASIVSALCDGARVWLNGIRDGEIRPDAPSRFAPDSEAAACAARLLDANEGDVVRALAMLDEIRAPLENDGDDATEIR